MSAIGLHRVDRRLRAYTLHTVTLNSTKEIATIEIFNEAGRTIDKATSTHFSLPTTGWFVLGITYTDGTKQAAKLFVSQ